MTKNELQDALGWIGSMIVGFEELIKDGETAFARSSEIALKHVQAEAQMRVPEPPKRMREGRYSLYVGDCPFCGRLVDSEGNYCKRCGKALEWKPEKQG